MQHIRAETAKLGGEMDITIGQVPTKGPHKYFRIMTLKLRKVTHFILISH